MTFSCFFFFFETNSLDGLEISSNPQRHTCLSLLDCTIIRILHHARIFTQALGSNSGLYACKVSTLLPKWPPQIHLPICYLSLMLYMLLSLISPDFYLDQKEAKRVKIERWADFTHADKGRTWAMKQRHFIHAQCFESLGVISTVLSTRKQSPWSPWVTEELLLTVEQQMQTGIHLCTTCLLGLGSHYHLGSEDLGAGGTREKPRAGNRGNLSYRLVSAIRGGSGKCQIRRSSEGVKLTRHQWFLKDINLST